MSNFPCPQCLQPIPLEDVNVSRDLALCRRCGNVTPFSRIAGLQELSFIQLEQPPKGISVHESVITGLEIVYRKFSKAVLVLIPFTMLWSGGSIYGIYVRPLMQHELTTSEALFGLPFLFGTIVLVSIIIFVFFGHWKITLKEGSGKVFVGVGGLGWERRFVYRQNTSISVEPTDFSVNEVRKKAVVLRSNHSEIIKFGTPIDDEAMKFIAALITKECQKIS